MKSLTIMLLMLCSVSWGYGQTNATEEVPEEIISSLNATHIFGATLLNTTDEGYYSGPNGEDLQAISLKIRKVFRGDIQPALYNL